MSTLLAKWLNGDASPTEISELRKEYNLEELSAMLKAQETFQLETIDGSLIWEKIKESQSSTTVPKKSIKLNFWIIALLVLMAIAAGLYIFNSRSITISTPNGEIKEHYMVDNTKVILSPNSKISYVGNDWLNNRKVNLQGQAYFDVTKGREFSVETSQGKVTVLGTEFEIQERPNYMQVKCMEGSVRVDNHKNSSVVLKVGDKVILNNSVISDVLQHQLTKAEFLSNQLLYDNISIVELGKEIERFYNVDVVIQGELANQSYTGNLLLNDLDKAISYLSTSLNCKVNKDINKITFYN